MVAVVAPLRRFGIVLAALVGATMFASPTPTTVAPRDMTHFTMVTAGDLVGVVARGLGVIGDETETLFERLRAMTALAEYRARRAEHERCSERTDGRRECRRHRPIRISKACLENPLARACM
jgi:hypothetical protein